MPRGRGSIRVRSRVDAGLLCLTVVASGFLSLGAKRPQGRVKRELDGSVLRS